MINPNFYNTENLVKEYFNGITPHYPIREKATVVGTYVYVMKYGETMYSIARELFGNDREYMWTILADMNEIRQPDDWEVGEKILLPKIIVNESAETRIIYSNVKTNTTTISTIG